MLLLDTRRRLRVRYRRQLDERSSAHRERQRNLLCRCTPRHERPRGGRETEIERRKHYNIISDDDDDDDDGEIGDFNYTERLLRTKLLFTTHCTYL